MESPACTRHLPWSRSGPQGGVPVYRPRLAVREHAQVAPRHRANRRRNLCRSRSHHDALARQAAHANIIFVDHADADAVAKAEEDLRQTEITQPAVLAIDLALTRLLAAYGIEPDFTMGHSLGEYGALVAAGGLPFTDSLEAVSARGRGMTQVAMDDNGRMAAVFAPLEEVERILKTINGYVVIANVNSNHQAVIGGASKPVEHAMEAFQKVGYDVAAIPVSHAFHTSIVAGASKPLREVLQRLHLAIATFANCREH